MGSRSAVRSSGAGLEPPSGEAPPSSELPASGATTPESSRGVPESGRGVTPSSSPQPNESTSHAARKRIIPALYQRRSKLALMSDDAAHTHHAIDYIEIAVTDVAAAKRFYGEAFGWRFNDYGPGYAGIRGEGKEAGGLAQSEKVRAGGPLVVLFSKDLDATLKSVRAAGGTISKEPFDFPGGRRFEFTDPSGNQLAVWAAR